MLRCYVGMLPINLLKLDITAVPIGIPSMCNATSSHQAKK